MEFILKYEKFISGNQNLVFFKKKICNFNEKIANENFCMIITVLCHVNKQNNLF